jgi:hypothetical protein
MQQLNKGQIVKLSPVLLEDESKNANHFLYKRIIEEERTGEVLNYENSEYYKGWWVKFHYAKILLQPEEIIVSV